MKVGDTGIYLVGRISMTRDELAKECTVQVYTNASPFIDVTVIHKSGIFEEEKRATSRRKAVESCYWRLGQRLVAGAVKVTTV